MGHAVESAGDVDVAEAAHDVHRSDVDGHHGRGAGALHAESGDMAWKAGKKGDRGSRVCLLTLHLDRTQYHAVDILGCYPRAGQNLTQDDDRQVVRADLSKNAPRRIRLAERRSYVPDERDLTKFSHRKISYNLWRFRGVEPLHNPG
jgi:hypothetical protein